MSVRATISILIVFSLLLSCNTNQDDIISLERTSYFRNITSPQISDSIIKVVTYNIKMGFEHSDNPWNPDVLGSDNEQLIALTDLLKTLDADIIALQEVPKDRYNSVIKNYIEVFAEEMEMNFAFGAHGYSEPGITPPVGEWGCAILSKFEILDIENKEIYFEDVYSRRSLLNTTLRVNDSLNLDAISLHWRPVEEEKPNTANYLASRTNNYIVAGDFNRIAQIQEFLDIGLKDIDSSYTIYGVDRIFINPAQFVVLEVEQIPEFVSDHFPSYGKLSIKK